MKKVLVIGGGLAGLSAATFLTARKYHVELIEASPKLGGRVYSFLDKETSTVVDNGQHLLMGCYQYTFNFLKLINATEKFAVQDKIKIHFVKPHYDLYTFSADKLFYPLNILLAFLRYDALGIKERIKLIHFLVRLPFIHRSDLETLTVSDLFSKASQTDKSMKSFWDLLIISAFNCRADKISAKLFVTVMKQIFMSGKNGAALVFPKENLTESFCNPAQEFIESNGCKIRLSEKVIKFNSDKERVTEVQTDQGRYSDFDYVISALPFYSLQKISFENFNIPKIQINYSLIINVHIWLKKNDLQEKFLALIDSPIHWVFNKNSHLNIVISDAGIYKSMSNDELISVIKTELKRYLLIDEQDIVHYLIVKEKRATFIPNNDLELYRPYSKTAFTNFLIAGDWTNTELPSTIESAVKSGWLAAMSIDRA